MKAICEIVEARGHKLIRCTHRNTIEITKDKEITEKGTCIIACKSNKAVRDLENIRELLKNDKTIVVVKFHIKDIEDIVICRGSKNLILTNDRKIIIRKSNYIDDATLCIESNKASIDIDRRIIHYLCMEENITIKICAICIEDLI